MIFMVAEIALLVGWLGGGETPWPNLGMLVVQRVTAKKKVTIQRV